MYYSKVSIRALFIALVKRVNWFCKFVSIHVCIFFFFFCRPVYVSAVRPQSKHIVVMVDHGASVTDTQLQIARDSALVILNAIDEHDKVNEQSFIMKKPLKHQPFDGICVTLAVLFII